jgi:hypothetical protein
VIFNNPFLGEDVTVCSSITDSYKYPINSNGRFFYMKDRKPIYADEVGETGTEMIKEYHFMSSQSGDYTFREDDVDGPTNWNMKKIDKTHPKWDDSLSESGKQFNSMLSMFLN